MKGKKVILSFTSGASEEVYHKNGAVGYETEELLNNLYATCNMCDMKIVGSVYMDNVSYRLRTDESAISLKIEKANIHANKVYQLLKEINNE